jgi:ligand-binding sensor domain-containing protein/signal transduction histidine kinase
VKLLRLFKILFGLTIAAALVETASRAASGLAPVDYVARTWSKADGLPQNAVTAVVQTRDGFLWVGTPVGLARFDGCRFVPQIFPVASNSPVAVTDLCEDRQGDLWIGTRQSGVFFLQTNRVVRFDPQNKLGNTQVNSLAVDNSGVLWIGTRRGLDSWDGKGFHHFTRADGLPDENVTSIFAAHDGTLWVTTRAGICVWRNGRLEPYAFNADSPGRNPEFLGVYEDRRKNLWAFGDTYLINLSDSLGNRLNNFRRGDLSSSRLWSLCETRDGRLWVGTSGQGLLQFTGDASKPFRPVTVRNLKIPKDVRSVCEDSEGNLWLGTDNNGLVQLHQERLRLFGAMENLPGTPVSCLTGDAAGQIWVVFASGGIFSGDDQRFELKKDMPEAKFVSSVAADTASNVWFGVTGFGVDCWHNQRLVPFDSSKGLADECITAIFSTGEKVWAGTRSGKIFSFENNFWYPIANVEGAVTVLSSSDTNGLLAATATGTVSLFSSNKTIKLITTTNTSGSRVSGLCFDKSNRLWIATDGGGLLCRTERGVLNWKMADGLPTDQIFGLIIDAQNNLWLTTAKGIYRWESYKLVAAIQTGRFLPARQIFPFTEATTAPLGWPSVFRARDELLWFGTAQGLLRFDPREWQPSDTPPPVYLENVSVNGETQSSFEKYVSNTEKQFKTPLKLSGQVRSLDFDFTSPCLAAPEKTLFRHLLEGFDEDWIEGDSASRRVHYGALPSGKYCFRVIACNADGTWNQVGACFSFIVPPPWWRTPWVLATFIFVTALFVAIVVRVITHRRLQKKLQALEQSQAMSRERMRIAQDMHDEIGSKLARISFLSAGLNNELGETEAHSDKAGAIADTSHDLLQSLDQMVWAVNPRNDTLENLVAYFGHYATEYFQNTSVQCDVRLPQRLSALPLSAEVRHNMLLAFEEALGNALKHANATAVIVEMKLESQMLEITITDNGAGFDTAKPTSNPDAKGRRERHGVSGMKLRLQKVGGECRLNSVAGIGTVVKFFMPLKHTFSNQ